MKDRPNWDMRGPPSKTPSWNPTRYRTECCDDIISSAWEGHFKQCSCGEAFVDETKYYTRLGGKVIPIEEKT